MFTNFRPAVSHPANCNYVVKTGSQTDKSFVNVNTLLQQYRPNHVYTTNVSVR